MRDVTNMIFRAACENDIPLIISLFRHELLREPNVSNLLDCILEYPSAVAFSEDGSQLLGFLYCGEFAPDVLEILNILVDSSMQSQGIGSLLLRQMETTLDSGTFNGIILCNSSLFPPMRSPFKDGTSFYEKNGFILAASTTDTRIFYKRTH